MLIVCMSSVLQGLQIAEQQFGASSPQAADAAAQLGVLYSQVCSRVGRRGLLRHDCALLITHQSS
jgi:hypothetical protein